MAAKPPAPLRFGRKARLKHKREFERLRRQGQRLANGCIVGNWERLQPGSRSRLGVITSGKLGIAVVRNRARRLMREAFRQHQHELSAPVDLVLVARASIVGKGFDSVDRDFVALLRKARLIELK